MRLRIAAALNAHLRALALEATESPIAARRYHLALLALHLAGLLAVARLAHWPYWTAPVLLAAFCLPQMLRRCWHGEALAPLAWLYALAFVRVGWVYAVARPVPAGMDYELALALCAAWAVLITLRSFDHVWLAWPVGGVALALLVAWQWWRLAPAGATGSDPFAYVQMALDLAAHGSPQHYFALAPLAARLGLPTLPVTHVGYVLPDAAGWAPTVWPAGYSALLAGAYRLGGERLLLGFNTWVGFASLAAAGLLAWQLAPARTRPVALAMAGAAVAILATSPEQWVRLAAPLADGAAQLLTTAAVVVGLVVVRARQRRSVRSQGEIQNRAAEATRRPNPPAPFPHREGGALLTHGLLGALLGVALAAAFSVRYTQALIAPGLVLVALWALKDRRQRWLFLFSVVVAGLLAAAPDLLYRTRLYGAPWRFGTGELALFELQAIPGAVQQLAAELLRPGELGWLWGLALVGAVWLWRRQRVGLLVVVAAYVPVVGFHFFYPFVRARDLLFVLAPLAALSAIGGAAVVGWLWARGTVARLAVVGGLLVLAALRVAPVLAQGPGFFTFGGLLPEQRQALASLATLTEPNAVIACSLNSGAVELYGQRLTVRPGRVLQPHAAWTSQQWLAFVAALQSEGRPLYLLMDSAELEQPLADLQDHYSVEHVADLYVPVYVHTGGSENGVVALWRVRFDS